MTVWPQGKLSSRKLLLTLASDCKIPIKVSCVFSSLSQWWQETSRLTSVIIEMLPSASDVAFVASRICCWHLAVSTQTEETNNQWCCAPGFNGSIGTGSVELRQCNAKKHFRMTNTLCSNKNHRGEVIRGIIPSVFLMMLLRTGGNTVDNKLPSLCWETAVLPAYRKENLKQENTWSSCREAEDKWETSPESDVTCHVTLAGITSHDNTFFFYSLSL